MAGGALKIQYSGTEASCLLTGDATAKTLTATVGDAGAEAADPNFGTAGTIDLTGASVDTLTELAAVIDAYAEYSCEIHYGDSDFSTEGILDQVVQAAGVDAYVLFDISSVLASTALVSWELAQEILGLDDDQQRMCERMINAASKSANRISGRILAATDYTKYLDGNGKEFLLLPEYPVNSVTELNVDTARDFGSSTEVASDEYLLYEDTGEVRLLGATFPCYPQAVKVVFNAGYATLPDDLEMAVIEVVAYNLKRIGGHGNIIGVKEISADGSVNTSYELTIPVNAQGVFESYRRET